MTGRKSSGCMKYKQSAYWTPCCVHLRLVDSFLLFLLHVYSCFVHSCWYADAACIDPFGSSPGLLSASMYPALDRTTNIHYPINGSTCWLLLSLQPRLVLMKSHIHSNTSIPSGAKVCLTLSYGWKAGMTKHITTSRNVKCHCNQATRDIASALRRLQLFRKDMYLQFAICNCQS